ncbi:ubiquitin-specific protease [Scheffersomyces stipitis CBS 6054]|uniref:ubiquitinyl hydrolase 1 n=1 Tax=Scheffersomyces stipitis (strain ATCC 58785 / CBS 6054 / NBRC 10063 / NRRL Y-11545) TaxID=322104 RepID=A3LTL3_PICST|nr:ubiquitin-specific protease [Scheffersomyces stipitis CBS 6054]ABN66431.2 ubiquitin-specific protease [Scheffersomyces stipitis CBS 6054]
MAASLNKSTSSGSKEFNPVLDRYLSHPLTFKPGRQMDANTSTEGKPGNYIILSRKKKTLASGGSIAINGSSSPTSATTSPKSLAKATHKPRSMAEAVAAYTGKKFLTKAEKKQLSRKRKLEEAEEKRQVNQDANTTSSASTSIIKNIFSIYNRTASSQNEDLGENVTSDNDSQYESASEVFEETSNNNTESESPFTGFSESESKSGTPGAEDKNDVDEEEEDEEDDDFNNSSSSSSSSVEDSSRSTTPSEEDEDEDKDLEKLKYDLKTDQLENQKQKDEDYEEEDEDDEEEDLEDEEKSKQQSKESSTPPTSPEEDNDEEKQLQFYDMGEDPSDRGSNHSKRIYKNWRELENKKPVGLLNHGVTCYMNSAIQAMVHIPAIQHYLNAINHNKVSELKPRSVSHVLADLSRRMWALDGTKHVKYVNPKKIIQRLGDINCMMSEWQQEDAHEYFMSLMSRLQEDSTPKGVKMNQSIIYDIFGGLLAQRITCTKCNNVSETKQEFYDLSLGLNKKKLRDHQPIDDSIPSSNRYSIEKSVRDFFSNELIKIDKADSKSGYFCEKCQDRTVAHKISFIDRSPEYLTVHLKRFKFNGNSSSKVKQSISYSDVLDLTRYTVDARHAAKYKLMAVIVHEGRSISSGHYIAHCLQPDGSWATYDDEYINKIDARIALADPSAYVLVYSKLTPKDLKRNGDGIESEAKRRKI